MNSFWGGIIVERKGHGETCCDSDKLLKCMCAIDQEIACFKECGFSKHVSHITREKILFCMIMRDIAKLDKKLDKILCELNSDWCSNSSISCSCDSGSDSCSDSDSDSHSHWHCPHPKPHKCKL